MNPATDGTAARRACVFLDRDGVVNEVRMAGGVATCPRDVHELVVPPDVPPLLALLRAAGFLLLVVTNQPDVARGGIAREAVERVNAALVAAAGLDGVYWCPHDNGDGCGCRKPLPGLVLQAAAERRIDLRRSWLVGDRWVDLAAARAAGVRAVLLEHPHSWAPTSQGAAPAGLRPDFAAPTLTSCFEHILAASSATREPAAPSGD